MEHEWMTVKNTADYLACSYNTALHLMRSGDIKSLQIRTNWRTTKQWIEEFIERNAICKR